MSENDRNTNDPVGALLEENREIETRAESLVAGLDDAAFSWRPEPGRWSVGECLEHLNLTMRTFVPLLDHALDHGVPASEPAAVFHAGFLGRSFARILEPPAKLRVKAPGSVRPALELSMSAVTEAFAGARRELGERVALARGVDLNRTKMHHPAIPVVRFSLGEIFEIIFAHERRHLWQAENVRRLATIPIK